MAIIVNVSVRLPQNVSIFLFSETLTIGRRAPAAIYLSITTRVRSTQVY
jgi:hypothetical protein